MPERRTINGELCERVERPEDLKLMDIVYGECDHAGHGFHRGALLERYDGMAREPPAGEIIRVEGWKLSPKPARHLGHDALFTDQDVVDGFAWRVVDEARDDEQYTLENAIVASEASLRAAMIAQRLAAFDEMTKLLDRCRK